MNLDMMHGILIVLLVVNLLLLINLNLKNSNCPCGKNVANQVKSCSDCDKCGN